MTVEVESIGIANISVCPDAVKKADPNAETLWPVFLKKVGLHFRTNGEVIENDGKRAAIVRAFAVESLERRLAGKTSEVDRARIWWREAIACSEGDSSVPDLATEGLYVLNSFIVNPALKFADPRVLNLSRGKALKSLEEKRAQAAARQRARRGDLRGLNVTLRAA